MSPAFAAATLSLFVLSTAWATSGASFKFDVPADSFLAIKYRIEPNTPVEGRITYKACPGSDGVTMGAHGWFTVYNGRLTPSLTPGGASLALQESTLEVGIEGHTISQPLRQPGTEHLEPYVQTHYTCSTSGGFPFQQNRTQEITDIVFTTRLGGTAWVNLTNTPGLHDLEIWEGPIWAYTPQHFEHGASASVAPPFVHSGSAGALLSQRLAPRSDFVGYWWPWVGESAGEWWCDENETGNCSEPFNGDFMVLKSKGVTTWDVGYNTTVQAGYSQHYVLVGVDLGRDDILPQD